MNEPLLEQEHVGHPREGPPSPGHHSTTGGLLGQGYAPSPATPERHDWRLTLAGIAGNVLEWYDFAVYGYFSDIIGKVFFPPNQKGQSALIQSYLVFGIAFLARPIGGAVFGYLGDTVGRKSALENSILLMAFPTVAIGCLPSFAAVRWLAPVLLVLCRILQGLSVGGNLMTSVVFILEKSPESEWGRRTATAWSATIFGTIIGGLVASALRETLDEAQLLSWGWRVPFFFGVAGIFPGWYLKRRETKTADCPAQPQEVGEGRPGQERQNKFSEVFGAANRRAMIASTLVPTFSAGAYYIVFVWMVIFMKSIAKVTDAFRINSAVGVIGFGLTFAMGWLADKVNKRVLQMLLSSLAFAIVAPIFISLIGDGDPMVCFLLQTTMAILLSCFASAMLPWLISNFPPHVRLTSVNISYNIGLSIVGGFAPALATVLVDHYGNSSPGYVITGLAVLAWIGLGVGSMGGDKKEDAAAPPETGTGNLSDCDFQII